MKSLDNKYRSEVYSRVLRWKCVDMVFPFVLLLLLIILHAIIQGFRMSDEHTDWMKVVLQHFEDRIINNMSKQNGYASENVRTLSYLMKNTLQDNGKARHFCESIICLFW